MAVHSTEKNYPEDPDKYDQESFDLAPRKNAYWYKYEIAKHSARGSIGLRRALYLFEQMKKDRLEPVVNNFSPLIHGCAKVGYTKRAFELYDEWLKIGNKPTGSMITSLIVACGDCPFPEYGIERLNWFRDHLRIDQCRSLNTIQYNSLIKAYGRLGQLGEASKVIQEMIDNNVHIDDYTFRALLSGCATDQEKGTALALRVYKRMRLYDIKPNVTIFNLLLRCIRDCGFGSPQLMRETLNELPALTNINQKLRYKRLSKKKFSEFEWMPLISDLGKSLDKAVKTPVENSTSSNELRSMDEAENSISLMSPEPTDSLAKAQTSLQLPNLLSDNHYELIWKVQAINYEKLHMSSQRFLLFGGLYGYLDMMIENNSKPDLETFTLMIGCLELNSQSIMELGRLADDHSIKRDALFYSVMIRRICKFGNDHRLEQALDLLDDMARHNVRPDVTTFEALALGCDTISKVNRLIGDVENCGFTVSQKMLRNLFKAALPTHDFGLLNKLIKLARKYNYKLTKNMVERLEQIRLDAHDYVMKIEKNLVSKDKLPEWCGGHFLTNYDQFDKSFSLWLKSGVELAYDEHPWKQFEVKPTSKRHGFVEFEKMMRKIDSSKHRALKSGTKMGSLYDEVEQRQTSQLKSRETFRIKEPSTG